LGEEKGREEQCTGTKLTVRPCTVYTFSPIPRSHLTYIHCVISNNKQSLSTVYTPCFQQCGCCGMSPILHFTNSTCIITVNYRLIISDFALRHQMSETRYIFAQLTSMVRFFKPIFHTINFTSKL